MFLILEVSTIIFEDCFKAFFSKCSIEFALADLGDFSSNSVPLMSISAVWIFDSLMNSTQ